MKICVLDFEFNSTAEPILNLVSVAARCTENARLKFQREFWLYSGGKERAAAFFRRLIGDGYIFVSYTEAEPRSLLALFGADRTWLEKFQLIDLYLEYRCLLNNNHELAYGEQYIKGKVIVTTPPPNKWELDDSEDGEDEAHHKPEYSLAAATFKLLGIKIDTVEKNEVRDLIIRGNPVEIEANRQRIQKYNLSDIGHMPSLLNAVRRKFQERNVPLEVWLKAALSRGDYSTRAARMLALGYPINVEKLKRFRDNVKPILASAAAECLEVAPEVEAFRWNKKADKYIASEKKIRAWCEAQAFPSWLKTDKGAFSISKKAFNKWFSSESPGFPGAFCRYLKTKQSLNGFLPGSKKDFMEFVGRDGRVRPYLGLYGSQTSRSQPSASAFIPLKAHWMRTFIEAPPGKALCGIDYASQEFLIAALLSQDEKMTAAYASGDVYLAFAKDAGLVPRSATKATHSKERNLSKSSVLGIIFDMGAKALGAKITAETGQPCTEEQAEDIIDAFYSNYSNYAEWKEETLREYREDENLSLPDGWVIWGDNPNYRSVGNFPIQGHGAVVMRDAVKNAQDMGLDIIYTLHDAIYMEFPSDRLDHIECLQTAMANAFEDVMSRYGKTIPIRLEGEAWSTDWAGGKLPKPMQDTVFMDSYIDDKGRKDLERYKKFFHRA